MTDQPTDDHPGTPTQWLRRTIRGMWRDAKSVYYANTLVWRLLKSAALFFLGLFSWIGANLILSYRPEWWPVYYVMAYGFVLLLWGPLTHLVMVPLVIRFRRTASGGIRRWFARHGTKANLTVFFTIVLILGTAPLGVMTFDFQLDAGGGGADVNPVLQCTKSEGSIHCHLSNSAGIDHVIVTSGGQEIERVASAPFDFDIEVAETGTVDGDRQFVVELRDANGDTIRRYSRRVDLVPGS